MGGYFSTSKSLSVTDYCWWKGYVNGVWKDFYGNWATASVTVTAGTGSTADYSVTVTTSNYNHIQIYLAIDGVVVLNSKDTGGKKTYYYSGKADIWGGDVSIRLGVGCSQYTDATMSFTEDTLTRTSWSNSSAGSLSCVDNGNNSFTISAGKGTDGTNNAILGLYNLGYRYSPTAAWTNWYYEANNTGNDTASNKAVSATISFSPSGTADTKTVYYRAYWDGTYEYGEDNPHKSGSANIKQYTNPGNPGKPVISYTKSRLTTKENWTFSWGAASAGNSNSPVKGYRIRLYKNGALVPIKDYANGRTLSSYSGGDCWYDRETTSCSIIIDPVKQGFLPEDNIQLSVCAYAKNGAGDWLWSGGVTNQITSDIYTVQNAGVMRPFYNGSYVEGQVFAKVTDTGNDSVDWVEADIVKTCVSPNDWVEAE